MPYDYWYRCESCGHIAKRYSNSKRCRKCHGAVHRLELTEQARKYLICQVGKLFDAVYPETHEEVEAILKEHGHDPEQVGKKFKKLADEMLEKLRKEMTNGQENEVQSRNGIQNT